MKHMSAEVFWLENNAKEERSRVQSIKDEEGLDAIRQHHEGRANAFEGIAAALRAKDEEIARLNQISADLCERCGWAMKFPDGCRNCQFQAAESRIRELEAALRALLPSNLGPLPSIMRDDAVIPVDMTAAEVRAARALLGDKP